MASPIFCLYFDALEYSSVESKSTLAIKSRIPKYPNAVLSIWDAHTCL
jgi:hypothetical protein